MTEPTESQGLSKKKLALILALGGALALGWWLSQEDSPTASATAPADEPEPLPLALPRSPAAEPIVLDNPSYEGRRVAVADEQLAEGKALPEPVVKTLVPAPAKATSTPTASPVALPLVAPEILRRIPADYYTIQLIASSAQATANQFVAQTPNVAKDLHQYATTFRGKPWYVVIYGSYPDKATATAALARVPAEWQPQQAWIKPIRAVHKELQQ